MAEPEILVKTSPNGVGIALEAGRIFVAFTECCGENIHFRHLTGWMCAGCDRLILHGEDAPDSSRRAWAPPYSSTQRLEEWVRGWTGWSDVEVSISD